MDEVECIFSALLAILFAHLIGAQNVSWAAFFRHMVMCGRLPCRHDARRGAMVIVAHGSPAALIPGTARGVLIGRHIENGKTGLAYTGTQSTLAILLTLVPDSHLHAATAPAWDWLTGMALLEPALLARRLKAWKPSQPW